jgi:GntR family transcriptional repressor for pyruvate dehydrogenase complex
MREVERGDVTARLLASFKSLISEGALVPGCKLPPERELSKQFGVSRTSLRQALKVLDIMGVLWQRVGDGTYLSTSAATILNEPIDFLILLDGVSLGELLETRLIVEPELAARAAERATLDDLRALRETLDAMEQSMPDHARMIELDLEFHRRIFQGSRNRVCGRIFPLIHRSMLASIAITSRVVDWKHTLRYHWPIYDAIDRRKPEEARKRMVEHLMDAKDVLAKAGSAPQVRLEQGIQPVSRGRRRSR